MALGPGIRLGPYEIESANGAGGLEGVYRARETSRLIPATWEDESAGVHSERFRSSGNDFE